MAEPVRARRLTDQEGRRLKQIVRRGKHGSVRVRRAMIIMASASGTLVPAIARLVAADEDTVRDVIHLFNQKGLAALDPRWAGGRPRLISDGDIEVIVAATRTRPEKLGLPFTHWSLRKLAAYSSGPGPAGAGRPGAAAADAVTGSAPGGRGRAAYRPPGILRGGDRPRPTSGDPPQPGPPTEAKGGLPPGRGVIGRSCARRSDRWGIRGRDAGDDHDQAGRFQAARARPDGQDQ